MAIGSTNAVLGHVSGGRMPTVDMFSDPSNCQVIDDGDGNWRMKFFGSGTFTPTKNYLVDIFLVGGGAAGASHHPADNIGYGCCGGSSGLTHTASQIELIANNSYTLNIGAGGETQPSTMATNELSGSGGRTSVSRNGTEICGVAGGTGTMYYLGGGAGGSGGGGSGGSGGNTAGGSNGSDGSGNHAGTGQGSTTREFGDPSGTLYAGGGGGGSQNGISSQGGDGGGGAGGNTSSNANRIGTAGTANTGGGGGGGAGVVNTYCAGGSGGSGIIVMRNHRS